MSDPIVESVIEKLRSRSVRGLDKYGVGLDREDLSVVEWLTHHQEELLDAAGYVEVLIQKLGGKKPKEPVYGPQPPTLQQAWELERETVAELLRIGQEKQGVKPATVANDTKVGHLLLTKWEYVKDEDKEKHGPGGIGFFADQAQLDHYNKDAVATRSTVIGKIKYEVVE